MDNWTLTLCPPLLKQIIYINSVLSLAEQTKKNTFTDEITLIQLTEKRNRLFLSIFI